MYNKVTNGKNRHQPKYGGNNMKYSRILAGVLAAAVSVSMLAACDSDDKKSSSGKDYSSLSSMDLVKEMTIGYNLGDTLDVCQADRDGDGVVNEHVEDGEKVDETLWGNPKATKELFKKLKDDGINAVRIPVTWRDHLGKAPDYKIDEDWMDRVKEVVDYAYDLEMYVIINVHHDGGGDPEFGAWIRTMAVEDYDAFYEKYSAIWKQIADEFEDYDERLIFESMNEVGFDDLDQSEAYKLLNKINQDFVDLIRKQDGNNKTRHLLIAGYWTDIDKTCSDEFKMPEDEQNRCIVSVHYYTPWEFCTTNIKTEWGKTREVTVMERQIDKLKTTFIDKGIPVIIGEYGTGYGNDEASKVFFNEMLTYLCHKISIPCFLWDNGGEVDRETYEFKVDGVLDGLKRAVTEEETPTKEGTTQAA